MGAVRGLGAEGLCPAGLASALVPSMQQRMRWLVVEPALGSRGTVAPTPLCTFQGQLFHECFCLGLSSPAGEGIQHFTRRTPTRSATVAIFRCLGNLHLW